MLLPLCAIIIWVGFYPAPILRRMEPTLTRLVEQVEAGAITAAGTAAAGTTPVEVR
jgi:NADH:ubiquinone oxidoreductase subunit 4 (subunit M)